MAPAPKQTAKPIFKSSSPFTETKWPQIAQNDQDIILDLVCNLIGPLGDHRRTHIHPSKGKKRKRNSKSGQDGQTMAEDSPPPPEIGQHILVGLNSVTRHLEGLAAQKAPSTVPGAGSSFEANPAKDLPSSGENAETAFEHDVQRSEGKAKDLKPLSMVILTHPKPSLSPAYAHLPTLVHLSNLPQHTNPPNRSSPSVTYTPSPSLDPTIRLIPLSTSSDGRLASQLHIPRVGALAIFEGAPGARALEQFVSENVDLTECAWVAEALKAEWRGSNVKGEMSEGKK